MILVWRGWGILALLIAAAFGLAVWALAGALGVDGAQRTAWTALAVAASGVVIWRVGLWFNRDRVGPRVAAYRDRRAAELHHLVEAGGFMGLPGGTRPTSLEQARAEAAQLLDAETAQVRASLANGASLFFVPMQHLGIVAAVGGIVVAVVQGLGG